MVHRSGGLVLLRLAALARLHLRQLGEVLAREEEVREADRVVEVLRVVPHPEPGEPLKKRCCLAKYSNAVLDCTNLSAVRAQSWPRSGCRIVCVNLGAQARSENGSTSGRQDKVDLQCGQVGGELRRCSVCVRGGAIHPDFLSVFC